MFVTALVQMSLAWLHTCFGILDWISSAILFANVWQPSAQRKISSSSQYRINGFNLSFSPEPHALSPPHLAQQAEEVHLVQRGDFVIDELKLERLPEQFDPLTL